MTAVRFQKTGGAQAQLLVFMWCRSVDIGVHHACSLLLQAWFITASVPTVTSTTATRSMTKGLFMGVTSPSGPNRPKFSSFKNEPAVNVLYRCFRYVLLGAMRTRGDMF